MSTPRRLRPGMAIALVAVAAALAGCGGSKKKAPANGAGSAARPTVAISVLPSATANRGRPLHAIVRTVTVKQFAEDQDRDIAGLVVSPDASVLASFVVFPGVDQTITIDRPTKGALAVYFLFTGATGTSWKQSFDSPPSAIRIELGENEIQKATSTPAPASGGP